MHPRSSSRTTLPCTSRLPCEYARPRMSAPLSVSMPAYSKASIPHNNVASDIRQSRIPAAARIAANAPSTQGDTAAPATLPPPSTARMQNTTDANGSSRGMACTPLATLAKAGTKFGILLDCNTNCSKMHPFSKHRFMRLFMPRPTRHGSLRAEGLDGRMCGMKISAFLMTAALAGSLAASATEEDMTRVLNVWNQQYSEYKAALQFAEDAEARAQIKEPDGAEIAEELWKSICGKTGERRGAKDTERKDTYEFQEAWAAPAVIWFVQHPAGLAQALSKKKNPQKEIAYYADLLLDSLHHVHYAHPSMRDVCAKLAEGSTAREYEILEKVYSRNQDKDARGCAALAMSIMLTNPLISSIGGSEAEIRAKRVYYLKQSLTLTQDSTMFGNAKLSEVASEQAYHLRYLMTGSVPPQITVKDMHGAAVKVPQQGKPHLLIFWAPDAEAGGDIVRGIDKMRTAHPGLEIVPVTYFATPDTIQQIAQQAGVTRLPLR